MMFGLTILNGSEHNMIRFRQIRLVYGLLIPAVLLLVMQACGPGRLLSPVVPDRAVEQVVTSMKAGQPAFDFFSARFAGSAKWGGELTNIAGTIRIRKDSAMVLSIAPVLGIEVARILITPGGVKMMNRLEGTYFEGDMGVINGMLNADLDYFMLQSILTGGDFPHFSTDNFKLTQEEERIQLYSPSRKRTGAPGMARTGIEQNIWLDKMTYSILQTAIYDRDANRSIQARYSGHTTVQGQAVPSELLLMFIDAATRAELSVRYSRIAIDQPQQITYSVPDRYKPADF